MRTFISMSLLSFVFMQNVIETREYTIYKDEETKKINVLEFINESNSNSIFQIEIIGFENAKYERNKIVLVMPCEIEMLISSKLSEYPVEFKLCKNKIASTLKLLINKSNPEIYFKHEKFKFIKGNIIIRISGEFSNTNKADNNDTNGILREWYNNGELFLEFNMKNGIKNGVCRKWHNNGELMLIYYYDNGKLHGKQTKWYSNGNIKAEWYYDNDVLHGISSEWYEDGKIKSVKEYNEGKLISS